MLGLRHLPLRYRLPLIHGGLGLLARLRSGGWRKAGHSDAPQPGSLVVTGFVNETLGIGRAGRLTINALEAAGYAVVAHDLRPAYRQILPGKAVVPGRSGVWLIHANAPECLIALMAHAPSQWNDRYRIGYWAWETSRAPRDWLFVADYLHEIWAPSHYVKTALAAAMTAAGRGDLIARLRVMPHPVPPAPPGLREKTRFGLDSALCEVLSLFDTKSSAARKNPWGVIDAWRLAFPEPAVRARLTLKVADLDRERATEQRLLALLTTRPDIRLVCERYGDAEMQAFIAAFDVLISLHRSEGFGLTLAEAMAAGVAVIATAGSGNDDFMNAGNARLVPAALVPVRDADGPYGCLEGDPAQLWGDPDLAAAAQALRDLTGSQAVRDGLAAGGPKALESLDAPWRRKAMAALPLNAWL